MVAQKRAPLSGGRQSWHLRHDLRNRSRLPARGSLVDPRHQREVETHVELIAVALAEEIHHLLRRLVGFGEHDRIRVLSIQQCTDGADEFVGFRQ